MNLMFKHSNGFSLLNPHKVDKLIQKSRWLSSNGRLSDWEVELFNFERHPSGWWTNKEARRAAYKER